jgi:sugar lactone lactonase YvrE
MTRLPVPYLVLLCALLMSACAEDDVPLGADYTLQGDVLHPEGIAFDSATRRFFFGSLTEGTLFALDAEGVQTSFAEAPAAGTSMVGLAIDEERRVLWACAQGSDLDAPDTLRRYDVDSGALLGVVALEAVASDAQCNDLIVDASGQAYVSDPASTRIYRVSAEGTPSVFLDSELLTPEVPTLGSNGITLTDDGSTLIVAYFSPPKLFTVPVASPGDLVELELSGDVFEGVRPFSGPDGLVMHRGELIVVFDDAVFQIALNEDATSGVVASVPLNGLSGLSTAAIAEDQLYVSKSEVFALVLNTEPELPFRIVRIQL